MTARGLVAYADPFHAGRHPFQTYLLALCSIAGVPLIFGRTNSGSVEELLPGAVAIGWGFVLCVGALVALVGSYWPIRGDKLDPRSYATALTIERVGLAFVGPGALVYAAIIVLVAGWSGVFVAAITAGFGWAAVRRQRDVARVFGKAIRER